jgi:DNA-binding Lrp family transcriptional regulator
VLILEALDKKIIAAMQGDLPLMRRPYRDIAMQAGITEGELVDRLRYYRERGFLRKMGAVLRHREIGYVANALCAWKVAPDRLEEVGKMMAENAAVTHCYARVPHPDWPYNLYIMLHAHTRQECRAKAEKLAASAGLNHYVMLYSTKEWKKSNVRYFREVGDNDY